MSYIKDVAAILRMAVETIDGAAKDIRARMAGEMAPGNRHLNDVEFMAYMALVEERSPRVPIGTPQGHMVTASPQVLAMNHDDAGDGQKDLKRYSRLTGEIPRRADLQTGRGYGLPRRDDYQRLMEGR